MAEAPPLIGQVAQLGSQGQIRRTARPIADHLPISVDDAAGPPFRQAHDGPQMRDCLALGGGPLHFFREKLAKCNCIQHLLSQKLLQLGVLVLELLQPLRLGDIDPAIAGLPVVQRRFRDAVLARQIGGLRPSLVLAQNRDDLLLSEPCSLHLSVLVGPGL